MQAIGMDGMAFLETEDPVFARTMRVVYARALHEMRKHDKNRATLIANEVGKLFKSSGGR